MLARQQPVALRPVPARASANCWKRPHALQAAASCCRAAGRLAALMMNFRSVKDTRNSAAVSVASAGVGSGARWRGGEDEEDEDEAGCSRQSRRSRRQPTSGSHRSCPHVHGLHGQDGPQQPTSQLVQEGLAEERPVKGMRTQLPKSNFTMQWPVPAQRRCHDGGERVKGTRSTLQVTPGGPQALAAAPVQSAATGGRASSDTPDLHVTRGGGQRALGGGA